jgi:hypothetical protein
MTKPIGEIQESLIIPVIHIKKLKYKMDIFRIFTFKDYDYYIKFTSSNYINVDTHGGGGSSGNIGAVPATNYIYKSLSEDGLEITKSSIIDHCTVVQ